MADFNCARCHTPFKRARLTAQPPKFCSRLCASRSRTPQAERVSANRAFVSEVNARTTCAQCGAQPIEWHNPEHVELNRELFRIGSLVYRAKNIGEIQAEMDRCTPLCRRCHMAADGRFDTFMKQALRSKVEPAKPCIRCERPSKPLRRGLCSRCYDRQRQPQRTQYQRARRLAAKRRVAS